MTIPSNAIAYDSFDDTSASGWPVSDSGHTWSLTGAGGTVVTGDWTVDTDGAHADVPVAGAYRFARMAAVSLADVDMSATATSGGTATGAQIEILGLMFRITDTSHYYLVRVNQQTDGTADLQLFGYGAASDVLATDEEAITYTSGDEIAVRVDTFGARIRAKIWKTSGSEPTDWNITHYDSGFIGAGAVGLRSGVASGNTNSKPVETTYTEFWAAEPAVLSGADMLHDEGTLRVEIAFGADLTDDEDTWPWVDVTADVFYKDKLKFRMGRADETSKAQPATLNLTLVNQDGDYSAYNPNGAHYPNVRRNTPVRATFDAGDGATNLFVGYANGFVPKWNTNASLATVLVAASGLLRRLGQGKKPLRGALYRALTTTDPVVYWPLEDADGSTSAASGLVGGSPLGIVSGTTVSFAKETGPGGSAPLPDFSAGGTMRAPVPAGSSSTSWRVECSTKIAPFTGGDYTALMTWSTSGDIATWELDATALSEGGLYFNYYGADGSDSLLTTLTAVDDDEWHRITFEATKNGTGIDVEIFLDGDSIYTHTIASLAFGTITGVVVNPMSWFSTRSLKDFGHLAIWAPWSSTVDTSDAATGYSGETADTRLTRICAEEGVDIVITGTSTTKMGPQPIDTFPNILTNTETTDQGVLYDGFGKGLGYICRESRYQLDAAITLDMSTGQVATPFEPADDDQRNRNDVTVTRSGGTSAQYVDEDGPLGTDAIGTYDTSITVNTEADYPLLDRAKWEVHLGTVEGYRYPTLPLDFVKNPTLISDWLAAADISFRADVTNIADTASQHPPDDVSLIVEGYSMEIDLQSWKVTANCSNYAPWDVAVWGTDRYDSGSSTLAADIDSTDTSFDIDVADTDGLWSTTGTPYDINIGGERMTVTAMSGSSSPQTATVTRSVNGVAKGHSSGDEVHIWKRAIVAL